MKRLKLLILLSFSTILLISLQVAADEKGAKNEKLNIEIKIDVGDTEITLFGHGVRVLTPSSVFLRTFIFNEKLNTNELELIRSNLGVYANYIKGIKGTVEDTGEILYGVGYLNKAGVLTVKLHSNGAGTTFPKGW